MKQENYTLPLISIHNWIKYETCESFKRQVKFLFLLRGPKDQSIPYKSQKSHFKICPKNP
jgi:hypothetical protein